MKKENKIEKIDLVNQEELFKLISNTLKQQVECFAIGGTAMMYQKIKDVTKDIDLVFNTKEDKEIFKNAIKELGYKEARPETVYGRKIINPPEVFVSSGPERFDLFVNEVIDFYLSESMKQRCVQLIDYGILKIKIVNLSDILIMKCATLREGDRVDGKIILDIYRDKIDWGQILNELEVQESLGKKAFQNFSSFLEEIEEKQGADIPQEFKNKLKNKIRKIKDKK